MNSLKRVCGQYEMLNLFAKTCHTVKFTHLAASSTQPQFQGPLPPLFSSGETPLQHVWHLIKVENGLESCLQQEQMSKRLTFHCVDHIPSFLSRSRCLGS